MPSITEGDFEDSEEQEETPESGHDIVLKDTQAEIIGVST